jgi:ribonuclease BN (tRNA processing enzyme)
VKVTLLGTGGPTADPRRHECCTLVSFGETHVLVDAGRGAAVQLRRVGVDVPDVDLVLLTHHHVDHLAELASLVRMSWFGSGTPLRVLGPPGTRALVDQLLEGPFAPSFAADRAYDRWRRGTDGPAALVEVDDVTADSVLTFAGWTLRAAEVEHGQTLLGIGDWWRCLGYRIDAGTTSVVVSGDCTYSPGLVDLAREADLLVQACSRAESELVSEHDRQSAQGFIASAAVAGRIAADARVRRLALTHLGPDARVTEIESDVRDSFGGPVVLGSDLLGIELEP